MTGVQNPTVKYSGAGDWDQACWVLSTLNSSPIPPPTLTFFTLLPWPLAQMRLSDMDPAAQADLRSRRASGPQPLHF